MTSMFRSAMLRSVGAAALLVSGVAIAEAQTVTGGGSTLAGPAYLAMITDDAAAPATYDYFSSGSGAAQNAFLSNVSIDFGGAAPAGVNVDFGASDATLTAAQISSFLTPTNTHPLIQLPTFGTPITVPFHLAGKTSNGAVNLTDDQICGVFSGLITDWHTIDSTIPAGTGIKVAYRSDGSGTSFLMTQHLGAVCTTTNSNFFATGMLHASTTTVPFGGTTTFISLWASHALPSTFIPGGETGSPGVQAAIETTANSIGYLSPDYTAIAGVNAGITTVPFVASVNSILPQDTKANGNALTNAFLAANLPNGGRPVNKADQTQWVPAIAKPANFTLTGGSGVVTTFAPYPIVGYTTWDITSCYAGASTGAAIVSFLNNMYNTTLATAGTSFISEITNRGFVPVSGAGFTALTSSSATLAGDIFNTFLGGSTSTLAPNTTTACSGGR